MQSGGTWQPRRRFPGKLPALHGQQQQQQLCLAGWVNLPYDSLRLDFRQTPTPEEQAFGYRLALYQSGVTQPAASRPTFVDDDAVVAAGGRPTSRERRRERRLLAAGQLSETADWSGGRQQKQLRRLQQQKQQEMPAQGQQSATELEVHTTQSLILPRGRGAPELGLEASGSTARQPLAPCISTVGRNSAAPATDSRPAFSIAGLLPPAAPPHQQPPLPPGLQLQQSERQARRRSPGAAPTAAAAAAPAAQQQQQQQQQTRRNPANAAAPAPGRCPAFSESPSASAPGPPGSPDPSTYQYPDPGAVSGSSAAPLLFAQRLAEMALLVAETVRFERLRPPPRLARRPAPPQLK